MDSLQADLSQQGKKRGVQDGSPPAQRRGLGAVGGLGELGSRFSVPLEKRKVGREAAVLSLAGVTSWGHTPGPPTLSSLSPHLAKHPTCNQDRVLAWVLRDWNSSLNLTLHW